MSGKPLVSVLLPVRDGENTLPRALDSLLAQSMGRFEIIAVNDGSCDGTANVLDAYAAKDPRVIPLHCAARGLVPALEEGLRHCTAPFVARMDADDVCLCERLEKQVALLQNAPHIGVASCLVQYGGDRSLQGGYARHVDWANSRITHEQISLARFRESPLPHPSVMFRRELVERFGGYRDGNFPEDYELWLRWLDAGVRFEKVAAPLLQWNDPPGRLSRCDPRYGMEQFYQVKAHFLARWLQRHNPFHPVVHVLGAGRVSRKRAEALCSRGVQIETYYDVDPRKIGHVVNGRPVLDRNDVPPPGKAFLLSYVANHDAFEDIRGFLEARGHVMGRDFIPAA